jgi:hypothetical protein
LKRTLLLLGALALLTARRPAQACPCSDDAGNSASLARADERYAVALVATSRQALGRFDAQRRYHALSSDEAEASEELLLRAALRWPMRVEWLGELGYASYRFHAGRIAERQAGVGDGALRTRVSLLEESMPHEPIPWPAFAVTALLRAPLGTISSGRSSSFGSGGAQLGLGAWEAGGGVDLKRSVATRLELLLGAEAAYRFEDHALAKARRLGPRLDSSLALRLATAPWLANSLGVRYRVSGDVDYDGQRLPGTGERLLSIVLGAAWYGEATGLRSSLTLSLDPPLRSVSAGSTAVAALGVALGYGSQ